ncbi:hypothetical protein M2156_004594 [Streptomyces sp. SAI-149]|nr:hypothetical protein [Streptomyces sp. SAI-149]
MAVRVASVMRLRGASMRPARIQPPRRPNTSRNAMTAAAVGAKPFRKKVPGVACTAPDSLYPSCPFRRRYTPTAAMARTLASMRNPA